MILPVELQQTLPISKVVGNNLEDAHELIDHGISTALKESKPVYISIFCNLSGIPHSSFAREPVPYCINLQSSNLRSLEATVEAAVKFLNGAVKPILVGGPKLRVCKAKESFMELVDACSYAYAVVPSAKGQVLETHPHFIGTYWGAVSTAYCAEIVESADAYLFAGPIFNGYSFVGYSFLVKREKVVIVNENRVKIANGPTFGCVLMKDFLKALSKKL